MPPPDNLIVLDEDMSWRLARDIGRRGRRAAGVKDLELNGLTDPPLISALGRRSGPLVLVTWDNNMVNSHRASLVKHRLTLAVIDRRAQATTGLSDEEYYREVTHRWAHVMAQQPSATWRMYRPLNWSKIT